MKNLFLLLIVLTIGMTSCVKQEFDQPPVEGEDPGLTATHTIADLLSLHTQGEIEEITEEMIVRGVVVADDESGNFYQNFVIQDETGGIVIRIGLSDAWVFYKTGREVFVKCKGLFLGDFAGVTQVGGYTYVEEGRTELGLIVDYNDVLIRGKRQAAIAPKVKTIASLGQADISTLITLENVQIVSNEVGLMISDPVGPSTLNRYVEDCFGQEIVLRSSGFADFAADILPGGKGTITGVYSQFLDTRQILIRGFEDIQMDGPRCGEEPVGPKVPVETINENFSGVPNNVDVGLEGWTVSAAVGDRLWRGKEFDGNTYAQATAYNGGDPADDMETWMITPPIIMGNAKNLSFKSAVAFFTHNGLSIKMSENFDCENPDVATWTDITAEFTLAGAGIDNYAFVDSGVYGFSSTAENVNIAFVYNGGGNETASYIIDDVIVDNQ